VSGARPSEQALAVPVEPASGLAPSGFDPSRDLTFRLTDNVDPEERLEEAALWKAMHDEYGSEIRPVKGDAPTTFGRLRKRSGETLRYWTDPAFLTHCRRSFTVCDFAEVQKAVMGLHRAGLGAFLKSTRDKHWIGRVPLGADVQQVIGEMAFSFIDGGPQLMVQELCRIDNEHRFFVIGRNVVTHSRNSPELTPLDYDVARHVVRPAYMALARKVAAEMREPHAVVDIGDINGEPGVVEFNPLHLGSVGLFACDVRALARASRAIAVEARRAEDIAQ